MAVTAKSVAKPAPAPAKKAALVPPKSSAPSGAVGFNLDQQTTGLLSDADVQITDAKFVFYDFNGTAPEPRLVLAVEMIERGADRPRTEYAGLGDEVELSFAPSDDGHFLVKMDGAKKSGLNQKCKAMLLVNSLVAAVKAAGLGDIDLSAGNIHQIVGYAGHIVRREMTIANSNPKFAKKDGSSPQCLEFTEAFAPFYEGGAAEAEADEAPDFTEQAATALQEALAKQPSITKSRLSAVLFQLLAKNPNRQEIINTAFDDAFLHKGAEDGQWTFDGTKVARA